MKALFSFLLFILFTPFVLNGASLSSLQYQDIKVTHTYNGKSKDVTVKREIDPKCLAIGINVESVFGGDMASVEVPKECKKTFVTTLGSIQRSHVLDVKTATELDVLDLLVKAAEEPEKFVLIDSRRLEWFEKSTIPSAVNLPYNSIKFDPDFPEDFEKVLKTLNIKVKGDIEDGEFDFSNAKTAILFCNGNWCVQSARAIGELRVLGYPSEKLMWYRGGLQDWFLFGLTTIRGDLK